jgi:pimeloyl-ACP methyl ester carboxylesterase
VTPLKPTSQSTSYPTAASKPQSKTKSESNSPKKNRHWRGTDIQAGAKLAVQATVHVTHLVEEVHQSVLGTLGMKGKLKADGVKPNSSKTGIAKSGALLTSTLKANASTTGVTGLVYESIRTITQWVGGAVDLGFTLAKPLSELKAKAKQNGDNNSAQTTEAASTPEREAVLAALNGIIGDRLASDKSPLATTMSLRSSGAVLDLSIGTKPADLGAKVLLVIHGLCMNDLQWTTTSPDKALTNHAEALAKALDLCTVYLRYNTGLSIADNGRQLSMQLEALIAVAPGVKEINVLSHSMGGLIIRSALQNLTKTRNHLTWPSKVRSVVFLGTPHHGAPLERAGQWIDLILGSTPFSAPFKRLTELRSTGINDLRDGRVCADNSPAPLPDGIRFFDIAATLAAKRSLVADRLLGDGLVPLNSALGIHAKRAQTLNFPKENQAIFYKMNHMELLSRPEVIGQLIAWFQRTL